MRLRVYFQESWQYCERILFSCGYYRNIRFVVTFLFEFHLTVNKGEEGMILADTNILSCAVPCTALANDDTSGFSVLSSEELNTKPLAF